MLLPNEIIFLFIFKKEDKKDKTINPPPKKAPFVHYKSFLFVKLQDTF